MPARYSVSITTPQGTNLFEGDRWEILSRLVSGDIAKIVAAQLSSNPGSDLDMMARGVLKVFKAYFNRHKRQYQSRVSKVGLELDLVKCYLRGLTISETVKWFKAHKGFRTSDSAIRRYWEVFRRVGIAPLCGATTDLALC